MSFPFVWLFTTRPGPVSPADEVVGAVSRDVPVEAIHLGPLDARAIGQLALDRLDALPNGRLRALLKGTGGSPFLAVELLDGVVAEAASGDGELLRRLVVGLRNRLTSLPPDALRLVHVGAVFGISPQGTA